MGKGAFVGPSSHCILGLRLLFQALMKKIVSLLRFVLGIAEIFPPTEVIRSRSCPPRDCQPKSSPTEVSVGSCTMMRANLTLALCGWLRS